MDFDELFGLYWVESEWKRVLSDREIFAEGSLEVTEEVEENQDSTQVFVEEKKISDYVNIDELLQQWANQVHIKEEIVSEETYSDSTENDQNITHSFYEFDFTNGEVNEVEEKEKIIVQDKHDNLIKEEPKKINALESWNTLLLDSLIGSDDTNEGTPIVEEYQPVKGHHVKATLPSVWNISKSIKWRNVFSELKIFIVLFFVVFSTFFFFTNAKLVLITVNDIFDGTGGNTVSLITTNNEEHGSAEITSHKQEKLESLEKSFQNIQKYKREEQDLALDMQEFLNQQQEAHLLNFNTLPPTNRLIVPDLKINVPLIDIPSMWEEDFENGNFDEELMNGVVKYPTTATPGSQGNSLIFWHSSSEWWKHNEYGFIFRNLPTLQPGQKIQVIWNWQLTTYEMIERKVVNPKEVWDYYHQFVRDWEYYLTLMGCYPIWSSSQRMMVVAKKVANE